MTGEQFLEALRASVPEIDWADFEYGDTGAIKAWSAEGNIHAYGVCGDRSASIWRFEREVRLTTDEQEKAERQAKLEKKYQLFVAALTRGENPSCWMTQGEFEEYTKGR